GVRQEAGAHRARSARRPRLPRPGPRLLGQPALRAGPGDRLRRPRAVNGTTGGVHPPGRPLPRGAEAGPGVGPVAPGVLRRAGLLGHSFRPQLVGLSTRVLTGWLTVADDGAALYAPHTSKGFLAPPRKSLLLVSNGLMAKVGHWQASRSGVADRLRQVAADA